jgi:suppressor of ftsI/bilirubin oxidase
VLVPPGQRLWRLLEFHRHVGPYLHHCHDLEHEDINMMRNYHVRA